MAIQHITEQNNLEQSKEDGCSLLPKGLYHQCYLPTDINPNLKVPVLKDFFCDR